MEEKVLRAAAALDELAPGWDEKVDVRGLDMMSWNKCILGQVFGDWASQDAQAIRQRGGVAFASAFASYKHDWVELLNQRQMEVPVGEGT